MDSDFLAAYTRRGFALLPLSRTRRPLRSAPFDHLVRDPKAAAALAKSSGVIGIATGEPSGVFVLDVDHDAYGDDSLFDWLSEFGKFPDCPRVQTPHGAHYYFRHDPRVTSRVKVAQGIDVKAGGGYVVAPPSRLPDGTAYFWDVDLDDAPIPQAPEWLITLLEAPRLHAPGQKFRLPDIIAVGERNDILFRFGCSRRALGASDYEINLALHTANDTLCETPLPAREVDAIVRSVCRYGIGTRNPPAVTRNPEADIESGPEYARVLTEFPMTQIGLAQGMAALFGEDVRWCEPWKSWVIWDGSKWVQDLTGGGHVKRLYRAICRGLHEHGDDAAKKWARRQETNGACEGTLKQLAAQEGIAILPKEFDADPWSLNCTNGVVDLRSGKLRPHRRQDYMMRQTAAPYVPGECPMFSKVISMAMEDDAEAIDWVWRWLGYGLTGSVSEEIFAFWWGATGQNGKSTILETMTRLLGTYAAVLNPAALMETRFASQNNDEIARLGGVRFVTAQEPDENARLSEAQLKHLTGGETMSVCMKYGHPFDLTPQFKLTISGNSKPQIANFDTAFTRRLRLVVFNYRVPDEMRDDSLKTVKLPMEYPAILYQLVAACRRWQDIGLAQTRRMSDATHAYQMEEDSVKAWTAANIMPGPRIVAVSSLYSLYREWCESRGYRPIRSSRFAQRIAGLYRCELMAGTQMVKGIEIPNG